MPILIRYLGTHLAFSFGVTLLLNWAILWYDSDLLTLGNYEHVRASSEQPPKQKTDRCHVIVGVLSAREHVDERRVVRDTWWSTSTKAAGHSDDDHTSDVTRCRWFVVGNESCPIHPIDRLTSYDCNRWEVNVKELKTESGLHLSSILQSGQWSAQKIYSSFSFYVRHPIVVSKLGVLTRAISKSAETTVVLEDALSKEMVAKVTIGNDLQSGFVVGGFAYRSIEPILLPMGYEGSIVLETDEDIEISDLRINYDVAGGVITFQHATRNNGDFDVFEEQTVVATSFGYDVHDVEGLLLKVAETEQRQAEWSQKIETDERRLREEMEQYGDIIVVDVLDVYRNLTQKLLRFYQWISTTYNYDVAIKVDDDTFLDIDRIENHLKSSSNQTKSWFGHFRHNWAVQRHGKWKELSYRSVSYPPFACGTSYALSSDLVTWLADNRNHLKGYQGEDVSMGIWMAAVGVRMVHDTRWQCSDGCVEGAFSRGQLKPFSMKTASESLKLCGNICNCT